MRAELVDWMKRTGDKGLIPEPELLRTMYPANEREQAAPPTAGKTSDGRVELRAADGASIAYTLEKGEDPHWLVYTKPVALPQGAELRAISVRLGFHDSEPVAVR
jgi:hypothetical protein